jgi:hypothetical protein
MSMSVELCGGGRKEDCLIDLKRGSPQLGFGVTQKTELNEAVLPLFALMTIVSDLG